MDEVSQMTQMSKIDLSEFNPEMSFSITLDKFKDQNDNNKDNLSIDLISNHLKTRLKKNDLTESVTNLTQCLFVYQQQKILYHVLNAIISHVKNV